MLCKLSFKNIKKSFKDYAIYFFTLVLGVSIFYVFNAIESQTVMMNVSSSTREIIGLMNTVMSGVSVFVSFILGFLIIYASRFLIKRRNKEFGVYLTLGMSKRKISAILLFETVFIGVISLVVGLILGVIFSQFMSVLVARMFEADLTNFVFVFSKSAFFKCILYFGIIYFIVAIFNVINVNRCKLIDLIHNAKKSEKVKVKNSFVCVLVFIISVCALSYAYYLVTAGVYKLEDFRDIIIPISIGAVSTFFIFWSLSGLILKIVMSFKNLYYSGLNSFVVRQVSSKINTMVMSMSVICLMLFVTICVLSSALSLKNSMTNNLLSLVPVDIEIVKEINEDSKVSVSEDLSDLDFDVNKYFKDVVVFDVYSSLDFRIKDTLGDYYDEVKEEYTMVGYNAQEYLVKLSDYNKVAKLFGNNEISLEDDEYVIVADFENFVNVRNVALSRDTKINISGNTYYPKEKSCVNGFIYMTNSQSNTGIFVVPDNALDDDMKYKNVLVANYKSDDKYSTEKVILDLGDHPNFLNTNLDFVSKISIYESSVGLGAMVTFIGLYLGIIFLISSALILALKELTESSDNKERYKVIRKIGASEKMINKALFIEIAIFFTFPLIIAVIHSVFGIIFCDYILSTIGNQKLLVSIIMTAVFLVVIYGGYFVITYMCSKSIIRE